MTKLTTAYLGLGSNLGDRLATLCRSRELLAASSGVDLIESSRLYEAAPVGGPPGQGDYLNAVLKVTTSLGPYELLTACQGIEAALGRQRGERWAARTLDLDLLLFGDLVLDDPALTLPHPRLVQRLFVLMPLCDLAPGEVPPCSGRTIRQLLEALGPATTVACRGEW